MSARELKDVTFVAEHVPETHRTLNNDHTVTEVELPGLVTVYLVIDGGRLPFTQLSGSKVLEAIERADQEAQTTGPTTQAQPTSTQDTAQTPEQPSAQPEQTQEG